MKLEDFSNDYLKQNFSISFQKWYAETEGFDGYVEKRISDINTREKIKSVASNLRDKNYYFTTNDLEDIKCFIKNTDIIFHSSQWTANFHTDIKLKSGADLNHVFLFNKIKQSANLATSGLNNIFEIKTYNAHFPHLYSIVKNVQDENNYPVYYPHWQSIYKWLKNENDCSYDQLTQFYLGFDVSDDLNKYKAFGSSINVFHIEYLRWCLNTNQGYKKTEEARRLLKRWHYENEQFLNEIHTPMQRMEYINLDKWRLLNETLFKAYIDCFKFLANKQEKEPAKAMVKALTLHGILMKVDEGDYTSFYTIARELGIYYQDTNDHFILGDIAQKYIAGQISYNDYLKYYILNTEFLINGEVVQPFEEIFNTLKIGPLSIDDIVQRCIKCIPVNKRTANATDKLNTFIRRAVDANLIKKEGDKYSNAKDIKLTEKAITKSGLDKVAFENEFVGTGKTKQENIVKQMINRNIPPNILDGNAANPTHNEGEEGDNKYPLNQILFGPPGTGKTDSTIEKALEILDLKTDDRIENREIFRNLLNKRIFFVTMHPSYSYEDFVQGIKPKTSNTGDLLFESKPGIFKVISDLATKIFEDEGEIIDNQIDNKDILRLCFFLSKFNSKADKKANKYFGSESNGEVFAIVGNRFGTNPNSIKNHRDKFDFLTTDERKGWQPHNGSSDKLDNTPLWPYHDIYLELNNKSFEEVKDIIKSIEKKKETKVKRTEENTNYVLILDEINRANISKVFGELITLIEEDKRIGNENELSVTLPSGESFSVPPNLYIIGTMNTADKSIALVDIALRRRFQFIPVYPNSNIVENFGNKEKVEKKKLMEDLNKLLIDSKSKYYKGVDFQIGHAYFLKNNSLEDVINENVIPLLTEYFRNDLEKVMGLLSECGRQLDEAHFNTTGLLKYIG
jgi:5-methylcytosine-specific restriction protein B